MATILFLLLFNSYAFSKQKNKIEPDKNTLRFKLTSQQFAYSGAMAPFQLANDWHGTIKKGKDGFFYQRNSASVAVLNILEKIDIEIGTTRIQHHEYQFPNDLARGFYYYNNDIELDNALVINTYLKAQMYSGSGYFAAINYQQQYHHYLLKIIPRFNQITIDNFIWGELKGNLFYQSQESWGGTIDIDYGYTEDHVAKRPLSKKYKGDMTSFDLSLKAIYPQGEAQYTGINLWNDIDYPDLPQSNGQISTNKALLIYIKEFNGNRKYRANAIHELTLSHKVNIINNHNIYAAANINSNHLKIFYHFGFGYHWPTIKFYSLFDIKEKAIFLSAKHKYFQFDFGSQTFDVSKSQIVKLNLSLNYSF